MTQTEDMRIFLSKSRSGLRFSIPEFISTQIGIEKKKASLSQNNKSWGKQINLIQCFSLKKEKKIALGKPN